MVDGIYFIHPEGSAWIAVRIVGDEVQGTAEQSDAGTHAAARDFWAGIAPQDSDIEITGDDADEIIRLVIGDDADVAMHVVAGPDHPPADLPEEYDIVRVRLTHDEFKRYMAGCKKAGLPDWEMARKAMRAWGLI